MLFFFKQKTAYEMRISDWSSDVCSSDLFAQCLVEAGMVGLAGGVAGWLLTLAGLWLVRQQPAAYADLAHLDLPMFLATFALAVAVSRSEEHTSELQSLMRISYAVFCLKKKKKQILTNK